MPSSRFTTSSFFRDSKKLLSVEDRPIAHKSRNAHIHEPDEMVYPVYVNAEANLIESYVPAKSQQGET